MTPTTPQPEYIITWKQIQALRLHLAPEIITSLCSRPIVSAPQYTDRLVPPGTIISVDEDCNITRYDGSIMPCCHRPVMTFIDCHVGYLPHGECPKWNYNHRGDSQKFIADVAATRNTIITQLSQKIDECIACCPSEARQKPITVLKRVKQTIESFRSKEQP